MRSNISILILTSAFALATCQITQDHATNTPAAVAIPADDEASVETPTGALKLLAPENKPPV